MKVRDLIARLQEMDPELPVCGTSSDWRDTGASVELRADDVEVIKGGDYYPHPDDEYLAEKSVPGPYVLFAS